MMAFLFLGFPSDWDKVFSLVTGLLIIAIAFKFKAARPPTPTGQVLYTEHKNDSKPRIDVSSTTITQKDTKSAKPLSPIEPASVMVKAPSSTITKTDLPITP